MNSKPTRRLLPTICLLLLGALISPAVPALEVVGSLPAGTQILLRVDARALLGSQAGKELRAGFPQFELANAFMQGLTGSRFEDVATLWFIADKSGTNLLLFQGNFDAQAFAARLNAIPNFILADIPGCPAAAVFTDEKKPEPQMLAMADPGSVAIGDEAAVRRFLEVVNGRLPALPAGHPQAKPFATTGETLLGTVLVPLHELPDFDPKVARFAKAVWLRGQAAEKFAARLEVHTGSEAHAQGIELLLRGLLLLLRDTPEVAEQPLLEALLPKCEPGRNGLQVSLDAAMTAAELVRLLPAAAAQP